MRVTDSTIMKAGTTRSGGKGEGEEEEEEEVLGGNLWMNPRFRLNKLGYGRGGGSI